jgi:hypothetical protein
MPKLIVHHETTIGYDVPRRLVEKLLPDSASLTEESILTPFVCLDPRLEE